MVIKISLTSFIEALQEKNKIKHGNLVKCNANECRCIKEPHRESSFVVWDPSLSDPMRLRKSFVFYGQFVHLPATTHHD
jgi:hypothetical protein